MCITKKLIRKGCDTEEKLRAAAMILQKTVRGDGSKLSLEDLRMSDGRVFMG